MGCKKIQDDYMNTSVHYFVIILFTDTYTVILRYDMKCFDQKQKSYELIFDENVCI